VDPNSATGIVRPLRTLEFALDRWIFGVDPVAFHLHSALWHGLAAALVCLLFVRVFGSVRAATAGGLVFALHPIQVESVAWVSSRGDVAMAACVLGAVLLALNSRGWDLRLAASLALGLAAMLYKETAVVLPLLVFACRLVVPALPDRRGIAPALRAAAPWLAVSVVYLAYRQSVMIGGYAHVTTHVLGGGTAGTFATMFRGFGYYALSLVVPTRQALDWYLPVSTNLADPAALGWLVFHAAVIVTAVRTVRGRPRLSLAICLFYFPLIPVANLPFALGIPTAERFLYLPMVGFAALVALGANALERRHPRWWVPTAVCCLALGALTIQRTGAWKDDSSLWPGEVATAEDMRDARAARRAGDDEKARRLNASALAHAHDAIDLWHRIERVSVSSSYVVLEPESNAANACLALGEDDHGVFHARQAVRIGEFGLAHDGAMPPQPYYNLAFLLARVDRPGAALAAMRRAQELGLALGPSEGTRFYLRLESVFREARLFGLGAEAARQALALAPSSSKAAERLRWYDERLEFEVDGAPSAQRALRLAEAGRFAEADRALAGVPLEKAGSIAWVRARHEGSGDAAGWRAARDAYDVQDDPEARYRQAVCQENLGEVRDAVVSLTEALASAGEDTTWTDDARRALARLRTGCPVRRDHGLPAE